MLLSWCGGEVTVVDASRKGRLTARQIRIALMLLEGKRIPGIAAELGIAVNTVKHHMKWIYRALDVRSRKQLISRYALSSIGTRRQ